MAGFDRDAPDSGQINDVVRRSLARHEPSVRPEAMAPESMPAIRASSTHGMTARTLLGLQRSAGNRAAAGFLQRSSRQPEATDVESASTAQSNLVGASSELAAATRSGASLWAAPPTAATPNLFGIPGQMANVQRHKTSEGTGAAKVNFESSGYSASIAKALDVTKDANETRIASSAYTAAGTVSAAGAKAAVKNYQVGFLQTMYEGSFDAYYTSAAHPPGKGAAKTTWTVSTLPIRDGLDAAVVPWYGTNTVKDFGEVASSSKSTSMYDKPAYSALWKTGSGVDTQWLSKTEGRNSFRSWIAVYNTVTKATTWLDNDDWVVTFGASIVPDTKNPAGSTVTPAGSGVVSATTAGPGAKAPVISAPVANGAFVFSSGTW